MYDDFIKLYYCLSESNLNGKTLWAILFEKPNFDCHKCTYIM